MNKTRLFRILPALAAASFVVLSCANARAAFIPLGRTNYFQNFDTLASSGRSKVVPSGWAFVEYGDSDSQYVADNGSMTAGGMYSYGKTGSSDRAFGSLRSGGDGNPASGNFGIFGADFQNASGGPINRLNISYTGEEWRLGAQGRGPDRLQFQYSLNASGVGDNKATWINAPALDFLTPNLTGVGAHDGTLAANQTQISSSVGFLNIPVGGTFWVRWVDAVLPGGGPEDGLAVDNFSILAVPETSTWCAAFAAVGWLVGTLGTRRLSILKIV